jgi:hypothetical protein
VEQLSSLKNRPVSQCLSTVGKRLFLRIARKPASMPIFFRVAKMMASLQSERAKLNRHAAFKALGTIE